MQWFREYIRLVWEATGTHQICVEVVVPVLGDWLYTMSLKRRYIPRGGGANSMSTSNIVCRRDWCRIDIDGESRVCVCICLLHTHYISAAQGCAGGVPLCVSGANYTSTDTIFVRFKFDVLYSCWAWNWCCAVVWYILIYIYIYSSGEELWRA